MLTRILLAFLLAAVSSQPGFDHVSNYEMHLGAASLATTLPIPSSPLASERSPSQLNPNTRYTLEGVVVNSVTGEPIQHALVQIFAEGQRSAFTGADGRFRFEDLPAGQVGYHVQKPGYFSPQDLPRVRKVQIGQQGGLQIGPGRLPALDLPVRIHLETTHTEGDQGPPRGFGGWNFDGNFALEPRDAADPSQTYRLAAVGDPANPSTVLRDIPAGRYWLRVYPFGSYYVQSARAGTVDLLQQELVIGGGESVPTIEVVLRDDPGMLNGSVSMGSENTAWVLTLPDGNAEGAQEWSIDPSGRFDIRGLAPGQYKILAMDRDDWEYGNLQALEKYLSGAKEITIEANQTETIKLELTKIEDPQQ